MEVKNTIVNLWNRKGHFENKNSLNKMVEQEKAEAIYQTMVGKLKKGGDSTNLEIKNKLGMPQMTEEKNEHLVNTNLAKKKGKEEVESLLEKRGYKYLVKWKNCSADCNSWEARFALPQTVVKVGNDYVL